MTATPTSRIYGDANPLFAYTVGGDGLVNSDTLSGALATIATTASGVGTYAITQGGVTNATTPTTRSATPARI